MIKLHLGCGTKNFGKDWIHIDGSNVKNGGDKRKGGDFSHIKYNDITKLPFQDNSVDIIYNSHVFEYFDRDECKDVLKEWYRVLKKGGILRIGVPDFEACAKLYVNKEYPLDKFVGMFYGKWQINDNKFVYHKTVYDFVSLKKVLEEAEFKNIRKWDWRNVEHGNIDDYSQAYIPHMDKDNGVLISLNVECNK